LAGNPGGLAKKKVWEYSPAFRKEKTTAGKNWSDHSLAVAMDNPELGKARVTKKDGTLSHQREEDVLEV